MTEKAWRSFSSCGARRAAFWTLMPAIEADIPLLGCQCDDASPYSLNRIDATLINKCLPLCSAAQDAITECRDLTFPGSQLALQPFLTVPKVRAQFFKALIEAVLDAFLDPRLYPVASYEKPDRY
jgi:hypothetical protein